MFHLQKGFKNTCWWWNPQQAHKTYRALTRLNKSIRLLRNINFTDYLNLSIFSFSPAKIFWHLENIYILQIDTLTINLYIMTTVTATKLKQSLWSCMQALPDWPIKITKRNRNFAYLVSADEYENLKWLEVYEDLLLWKLAEQALKQGTVWTDEAMKILEL